MKEIVKETLEKQLQLLSERSQQECTVSELTEMSMAMAAILDSMLGLQRREYAIKRALSFSGQASAD